MTLFTNEQMKGTGQLDMVALVNENEDRKSLLRVTPHNFFSDPSHGWLQVCYEDLKVLGILGAITAFSYRMDDAVYLEEDLDASTYITALFGKHGERSPEQQNDFEEWQAKSKDFSSNSDSFIRNQRQFYKG